jgi:hypothetical protein
MFEVTNELIYEVLRRVQEDVSLLKCDTRHIKLELANLAISDAYRIRRFAELEDRISRIETRLDLHN